MSKRNKLEESIISGLEDILDYKKGKLDLRKTSVELPPPPKELSKSEIKRIREKHLKVSQAVFAIYMGVSDETVKSWEQGKSKPKGPSLRLLNAAKKDRSSFLQLISA